MARWRRQEQRAGPPPGPTFHITRLGPRLPPAPESATPEAPTNIVGIRFTSPAELLTLLAAVLDGARHRHALALRAPDRAVWTVVDDIEPADVELAWALGGGVYRPDGLDLVSARGRRYGWDDVQTWPEISWVELAGGFAPGNTAVDQPEILVVTTGSLASWIIERFQPADLDIRVATAQLRSLFRAPAEEWTAVLLRVAGRGHPIPKAFARALSGLPHTIVCRLGGGRLLVDQRLALPLSDEDLAWFVPADQEWVLAGELGVWQLVSRSSEYAPPLRAHTTLLPPPVPPNGRLPADLGVAVTLVRDERPRSVDALLLSDDELVALRRFLTGQPAAERAFLVLGPGLHVFAEPARDASDIPFGVPLHRIGPGALYEEVGYRLKPALPRQARAELFKVDDRTLVVVAAGGAHRLLLANTVPVWSLWLGPPVGPDPTEQPLSDSARALLERVDAADARPDRVPLATGAPELRTDLRSEGFLLEQQGRLAEAAHKYWEGGEPALAARLYELAAEAEG